MVQLLRKYGIYTTLIYAIFILFTSCSEKYHEFAGSVWGTSYHIIFRGNEALADSAIMIMSEIDNELSMFNPLSTVSKINSGQEEHTTEMFRNIFELSKQINHLSIGAFDPTVGPLTNLWGFGTAKQNEDYTPTQAEIDSVLHFVGIDDCYLDEDRIIKKHPSTVFDFSSVAKGFGIDKIGSMFHNNGCHDFLIEIGGEVLSAGKNSKGLTWKIQIDAPTSGRTKHDALYLISLDNAAIATSGNYRNYRETPDGFIRHTIDPSTGRPAKCATASASVIAQDCATADALATACMVMDADSAMTMIESIDGVEALLAVANADSLTLIYSSEFPR